MPFPPGPDLELRKEAHAQTKLFRATLAVAGASLLVSVAALVVALVK